jgi:signal-transduction protein with cAMP-binding, CBS, and nucleotidyltransferase domain
MPDAGLILVLSDFKCACDLVISTTRYIIPDSKAIPIHHLKEEAMNNAEEIVMDKKREIVSIPHTESIFAACQVMVSNKIGALLVKQNDEFVGIWTERDLLRNVITPGFDPQSAQVGDYMTAPLHSVPHTTRLHKLEELFLGLFVRHLLVEKQGKIIGMVSIGDVLRASLLETDERFRTCNEFVTWEHYEKWRGGRTKES